MEKYDIGEQNHLPSDSISLHEKKGGKKEEAFEQRTKPQTTIIINTFKIIK